MDKPDDQSSSRYDETIRLPPGTDPDADELPPLLPRRAGLDKPDDQSSGGYDETIRLPPGTDPDADELPPLLPRRAAADEDAGEPPPLPSSRTREEADEPPPLASSAARGDDDEPPPLPPPSSLRRTARKPMPSDDEPPELRSTAGAAISRYLPADAAARKKAAIISGVACLILLVGVVLFRSFSSPNKETPLQPAAPVAESKIKLPEAYGFYLVDKGKTSEAGQFQTAPDLSPSVEFIMFDKTVAMGAGNGATLYRVDLDAALEGRPGSGERIECQTRPVKDNAEMIRIIPRLKLAPGLYQIERVKFFVMQTECRDGYLEKARQAAKAGNWERARQFAEIGRTILPAQTTEADRIVGELPALALKEAQGSLKAGKWDEAVGHARMAWELSEKKPDFGSKLEEVVRLALFEDKGDGTILDRKTGLQWSKEEFLIELQPDDPGISFCNSSETGGFKDWRKPTLVELKTLRDRIEMMTFGTADFKASALAGRAAPFSWSDKGPAYYSVSSPPGTNDGFFDIYAGKQIGFGNQLKWSAFVRLVRQPNLDRNMEIEKVPAVIWAAGNGYTGFLQALLKAGADPNQKGQESPALNWAVSLGKAETVKLLLDGGADPSQTSKDGKAALELAIAGKHPEMIGPLLRKKKDAVIPVRFNDGSNGMMPPLGFLAGWGPSEAAVEIAQVMLEEGLPADSPDDKGRTPLMLSLAANKMPLARFLIERGADPTLKDGEGGTAENYARTSDGKKLLKDLKSKSAADSKAPVVAEKPAVTESREEKPADAVPKPAAVSKTSESPMAPASGKTGQAKAEKSESKPAVTPAPTPKTAEKAKKPAGEEGGLAKLKKDVAKAKADAQAKTGGRALKMMIETGDMLMQQSQQAEGRGDAAAAKTYAERALTAYREAAKK